MSQPAQAGGERPSIRLSISSKASSSAPAAAQPAAKKRRYAPVRLPPHLATAANLTLHHQSVSLDFVLQNNPAAESKWYCEGKTTLYISDDTLLPPSPSGPGGNTSSSNTVVPLALHLKSSCKVTDVKVECVGGGKAVSMRPLRASFHHADPLRHVLLKPTATYTEDDGDANSYRFHADAQSSRGAAGITTGLRAASIASNMGELRLSIERPSPGPAIAEIAKQAWRHDLYQHGTGSAGSVVDALQEELWNRAGEVRTKRIDLIASRLAEATCKDKVNRAFKVTVGYQIPLDRHPIMHLAGIHAFTTLRTPHIYTTTGVVGDHEGPRSWMPCLDSAAVRHRASRTITIKVTASMREGLSCYGMGEDVGVSRALLHDASSDRTSAVDQLGADHATMVNKVMSSVQAGSEAHVIPVESRVESIEQVLATYVWCSNSWTPVPVRSMGFAIGPFKVIEDPEYFGPEAVEGEDDDEDELSQGEKYQAFLESARSRGEGIRQVYFAPLFERKLIHAPANADLLPNTLIRLSPLTAQEKERSAQFDQTVIYATIGVAHRALSLMRDVLALPSFRTTSYTQIWIPNAVHGGITSGALHNCPEVLVNPFLGGAIADSRLLPPVGTRLPYYQGGRVIQFTQARNAIRGWVTAALPLGGNDDVGNGYILTLVESFIMSLYERGHGAFGEGGAVGGIFSCNRYAATSGLNSSSLDFLPVRNIEETDVVIEGVGAVPLEERNNEQMWRSATNGTESHSSATDEFNVRQLLLKDVVEALERGTDKDKQVPSPSMGWFGSYLSLSFLSSNASSSSDLGCGAVDFLHPIGGLVYRTLKANLFRGVVEGRAGAANFLRLVRAAFIAGHLDDVGEKLLKLPSRRDKKSETSSERPEHASSSDTHGPKQPFVTCVNEILRKSGLTHTLFTRALQNLSGRIKEAQLGGTLVDVERHAEDPRTRLPFVDPEGFPNSYVRGASMMYCRVGIQVEQAREGSSSQAQAAAHLVKGIQMQAYAEPIIPEGGVAFGGPITIRVIENEGQFREFAKDLKVDGSRRDWGATFLHARPVTTAKAQTAASGTIEGGSASKATGKTDGEKDRSTSTLAPTTSSIFTESNFHGGGYQAIELVRMTNVTPLLWVRVDPLGHYGGRISVVQPDACLGEQLFHDGDAGAQVDAIRTLAERPLRIQGSVKITTVYDVGIAELPVRLLGDCLRGTPALHSSLPHTPVVRSQAALAIAQWQNNKAPPSKDMVGADLWIGTSLLIQYFRERFYINDVVTPAKFARLALKKSDAEVAKVAAASEAGGGPKPSYDDAFQYLDSLQDHERRSAIAQADEIEKEEDEEYRVRSAVVTALASIRAKDGLTPSICIHFLETVLESEDADMVGNLVYPDDELVVEKATKRLKEAANESGPSPDRDSRPPPSLAYVPSMLVADALLALCHINARPAVITDPTTGKQIQTSGDHPVSRLTKVAQDWLEWELYREKIRLEVAVESRTGISGNCHDIIAACAVVALSNLVILTQSTTDAPTKESSSSFSDGKNSDDKHDRDPSSFRFYLDIFHSRPSRNDLTKAACAQAVACICCAADRMESDTRPPVGLLTSLEFLLDCILDESSSPSLRHTLALIMMDACTGKVCSMQRIGAIAGRNELVSSANRFFNGPLGASHGGDNGSALLLSVAGGSFPAASAVNDGARRGLRLMSRAGHPKESTGEDIIVRVGKFATRLWRTINGEPPQAPDKPCPPGSLTGVCAYDGILRSSLLALWQWIWPRGCFSVLQVQAWKSHEGTERYVNLGAHQVMKISDDEKAAATSEENSLSELNRMVNNELDRQVWRGEMAQKAYSLFTASKGSSATSVQDAAAAEQGLGQPLPPIQRDAAFKQGGWIASAAQQRRAKALDGGTAVTKIRLTVKSNAEG